MRIVGAASLPFTTGPCGGAHAEVPTQPPWVPPESPCPRSPAEQWVFVVLSVGSPPPSPLPRNQACAPSGPAPAETPPTHPRLCELRRSP